MKALLPVLRDANESGQGGMWDVGEQRVSLAPQFVVLEVSGAAVGFAGVFY